MNFTKKLKSYKLLKLSLLFVIGYLSLVVVTPASATESSIKEIKEGALKIEQSQDELAKIKDNESISPEDKLELEITIRKRIISEALSLALKEVGSITSKLGKLPEFAEDTREYELKGEFFSELETFIEYYRSSLEGIEDPSMTLEEIKATAKDIIEYRESVYNPAIQEMVNFTLFFYTKDSINTAKIRLDKINSDLEKLEDSNLPELDSFKESINKTEALIEEARELNNKAGVQILAEPTDKQALPIEEEPVKESVIIEGTDEPQGDENEVKDEEANSEETVEIENEIEELANPEEVVEVNKETEEAEETPTTLIVKSLNNIKLVYETFLEVSIDIKKQLEL